MLSGLINSELICLKLKAKTKDEAFIELADMLAKQGRISNSALFLTDVQQRESHGNTGSEGGVALP